MDFFSTRLTMYQCNYTLSAFNLFYACYLSLKTSILNASKRPRTVVGFFIGCDVSRPSRHRAATQRSDTFIVFPFASFLADTKKDSGTLQENLKKKIFEKEKCHK